MELMTIRAAHLLFGLLAPLFFWGLCDGEASAQEYKVIVHAANPTSFLTKEEVSKLFLNKTRTWPDGEAVLPVDRDATALIRISFSKAIHGKSAAAVKAYWQRKAFTGRATLPPEKKSDTDVIAFVRANPGAIGYVSPSATLINVKVVSLIENGSFTN